MTKHREEENMGKTDKTEQPVSASQQAGASRQDQDQKGNDRSAEERQSYDMEMARSFAGSGF